MHLLGDAGYKIWSHLLTPFAESEAVHDARKALYNQTHSRTRITVECAFGRLKNRFRILLGKLEQKTSRHVCQVIVSCVVLHNLLQAFNDTVVVNGVDPLLMLGPRRATLDVVESEFPIVHAIGIAKRDGFADAFYGE